MIITLAKYIQIDGENKSIYIATGEGRYLTVPINPANTEYAEVMRQVEAGELTIAPADEEE